MRRMLVILDPDSRYACGLAAYFNEHEKIGFKAAAFTDLDRFRAFRKTAGTEILLISEGLAGEAQGLAGSAFVVLLSEDGFTEGGERKTFDAPAVFKYQSADRIARGIMRLYAEYSVSAVNRVRSDNCEILGVYSPVARCGKTSLSIALGLVRAEKCRTLLISLEEYEGVFANIARDAESDLSDLIYCYLQGNYTWMRLKAAVHSYGPLDYIPPVRCMEDVSAVSSEDLQRLIRRIAEESGYAVIVIDFGSFGRRASELMELCSRIFMPVKEDPFSALKLASFYDYLEKSRKAELKERLVKCVLPEDRELERDRAEGLLSAYGTGALRQFAERLH